MNFKILICDDNEGSQMVLREYIKKINLDRIELMGCFNNGHDLIEFCKNNKPHLILLDIAMPNINGIDTAKKILQILPDVCFIFVTAYTSYSLQSFDVHPIDYITKPISIERLEKSIKYFINLFHKTEDIKATQYISFGSKKYKQFTIKKDDLLFAERTGRNTLIHTPKEVIKVYDSLKNLESKLDPTTFVRTHNSYIVNKDAIHKIEENNGEFKIKIKNYEKHALASRRGCTKLDYFSTNWNFLTS